MRDTLIIATGVLMVAILLLATLRLEGGCNSSPSAPTTAATSSAATFATPLSSPKPATGRWRLCVERRRGPPLFLSSDRRGPSPPLSTWLAQALAVETLHCGGSSDAPDRRRAAAAPGARTAPRSGRPGRPPRRGAEAEARATVTHSDMPREVASTAAAGRQHRVDLSGGLDPERGTVPMQGTQALEGHRASQERAGRTGGRRQRDRVRRADVGGDDREETTRFRDILLRPGARVDAE